MICSWTEEIPHDSEPHPLSGCACSSNCSPFLQGFLTLLIDTHHGYAKPSGHLFVKMSSIFMDSTIIFRWITQLVRLSLYHLSNCSSGSPYWLVSILIWWLQSHMVIKPQNFHKATSSSWRFAHSSPMPPSVTPWADLPNVSLLILLWCRPLPPIFSHLQPVSQPLNSCSLILLSTFFSIVTISDSQAHTD